MKEKINVDKIQSGDVISFKKTGPGKSGIEYGVVLDTFMKNRKVVDFRVLKLTPYTKERRIPNDPGNLMIASRNSIEEMGLSTNVNWRLAYKHHTVPNTPRALGIKDDGTVMRMGQLDSGLYRSVFAHAERTIGLPDTPKEHDPSGFGQGLQGNTRMAQLGIDARKIERNVRAKDRKMAQQQAKKEQAPEKPKRTRRRSLPDSVSQLDISLEDAAKLNIITSETKALLERGNGKNAPKIETLRQAYELFKNRPELIGTYMDADKDVSLERAVKNGDLDLGENDIAFTCIAEVIGEKRGLGKPLSWAQTAAFSAFFPDFYKAASGRKTHFNKPLSEFTQSWIKTASADIDFDDTKNTLLDVVTGWNNFRSSEPHTNSVYDGVKVMYPAKSL